MEGGKEGRVHTPGEVIYSGHVKTIDEQDMPLRKNPFAKGKLYILSAPACTLLHAQMFRDMHACMHAFANACTRTPSAHMNSFVTHTHCGGFIIFISVLRTLAFRLSLRIKLWILKRSFKGSGTF